MTSRAPLDLKRLSPLQLGLLIGTSLLLVAVAALLTMSFISTASLRDALSMGYDLGEVSDIRLDAVALHQSGQQALAEGGRALDYARRDSERLWNRARRAQDSTSEQRQMSLSRLEGALSTYELSLDELEPDPAANPPDAAERLNRSAMGVRDAAQALYDREEGGFFQRVNDAISVQRTINALLLLLAFAAAGFAVILVFSMNHSIRFAFDRAYAMLEALYRADEEIHRGLSEHEVMQSLVDAAAEMMSADKVAIFSWDANRDRLVPRTWRGFVGDRISSAVCTIRDGALGRAAESGMPVIVADVSRDPSVLPMFANEEGVRSLIHMPVWAAGQSLGVLCVCYRRSRTIDADEQRLLAALARRAASAIENARLYQQVQVSATLEERQRLARELHDAVTQTLFSASLIAEVLPRIWERDPQAGRARLSELQELTSGALAEMRTLLLELRPAALLEAEIGELFQQLAAATMGKSRIPVHLDIQCQETLPPDVKVALYRIAQEALNNVVKHAKHASAVQVTLLGREGTVLLEITDDGAGFDLRSIPPTHLGLGIMNERAAQIGADLIVDSRPGRGTRVTSRWATEETKGDL